MADIRQGGGGRTVPFSGFVWSGVFLGDREREKNSQFLRFSVFVDGSMVFSANYPILYDISRKSYVPE